MNPPGLLLDLTVLQGSAHSERGTPRYAASHARALLGIPGAVRRLFLNPSAPPPRHLAPDLAGSPLLRWHTAGSLREALAEGPCAFHLLAPYDFSDNAASRHIPARVPVISTVFDLIPALLPDLYPPHIRTVFDNRLALMKRSDLLLAISRSAARDAVRLLGVDPSRVAVIGTGVEEHFKPLRPGEQVPAEPFAALGLDGPYLIAVLSGERRKNLHGLLDAMLLLPPEITSTFKLLVVGSFSDDDRKQHCDLPGAKRLGERMIFSGRISDEWLVALYQRAALNIYPSHYEGFGLPAAEAAACGCPTITSNTSSLPEVLGMPEATFDPASPAEMAALMTRVLADSAFRASLVERGLLAAREHTWARVAERTVDAVRGAADLLRVRTRLPAPRKPRIAFVGPLPPAATGIADYNERVCEELQRHCRLDVFLSHGDSAPSGLLRDSRCLSAASLGDLINPSSYDAILLTLGNSGHHRETLKVAERFPGWLWLHDVLQANLPYHHEFTRRVPDRPGDPLEPPCRCALGVIVHSEDAGRLLRETVPADAQLPRVAVIPLAFPAPGPRAEGRTFHPPWIIAHFGIANAHKHEALLMEAFAALPCDGSRLVFAGPVEAAIRDELSELANRLGVRDRVLFTGRMPAAEYAGWLHRAHLAVQLRDRSHGESSAALRDAMAAGTPVLTNMPCTEGWPAGVVARTAAKPAAVELRDAMLQALDSPGLARQSRAGLAFARENSMAEVVDLVLRTIGVRPAGPGEPRDAGVRPVTGPGPAACREDGARTAPGIHFLHIPKTAGTSFMQLLERQYRKDEICPAYLWRDLIPLLGTADRFRVFRGHFYAPLAGQLPGRRMRTVTFLRDPVARALSHYAHVLREPGHYFHRRALELGSLGAFLRDPETAPLLWNVQTRALGLELDPVRMAAGLGAAEIAALGLERRIETALPEPGQESALLASAKAALDDCACAGLVEQFDSSVHLIARCLGWTVSGETPRLNASPRTAPSTHTPGDLDLLREVNRLDAGLYEYAAGRFRRHLAEAGIP